MERRTNGLAIKAIRKALGIPQNTFAARVEITPAYLSQIERGHRHPPVETVSRIAAELGVPLDAITSPMAQAAS
jgi:transcriptional regulator with XRE-family HTH domain